MKPPAGRGRPLPPEPSGPLDCGSVYPLLGDLGARAGRIAIRTDEGTVSFADLERAARAHAARLRADGVGPGDRVALWATPQLPTLAAVIGNALLGFATFPLHPAVGWLPIRHAPT